MISLNLVGFELAKVDKGKKIKKVQANSVRALKKVMGKSRLYIVPRAEVGQDLPLPPDRIHEAEGDTALERPQSPRAEVLTVPAAINVEDYTGDSSRHHQSLNLTSTETVENLQRAQSPGLVVLPVPGTPHDLEEWRTVRQQQDIEYSLSLRADQEKDQSRQAVSEYEERRLKTIDERHMRTTEEPAGGIPLKFSFPDGTMKIRRFHTSDPMQALFDFVGSHASATEYFYIRETTSGTTIINTVSGTLLDLNITSPLNIHVRWMDMEDVQTIYQQRNTDVAEVPDLIEIIQSDFGPTQCGPAEEIYYIDYLDIMPESNMSEPDEMQLTDDIEIQCTEDSDCSPKEILLELGKNINYNLSCRFNINRNSVLDGAFRAFGRKSYDPFKRISVKFSDETGNLEEGVDLGGPRRELLSLLMEEIEHSPMLAGPDGQKNLALDSIAVREDKYYIMGKAISVSMVHGGPSPGFFSPTLFNCIVKDNVSPTIDDVHDFDLRAKIRKVSEARSMEELHSVVSSISDYLSNAGCLRAVKCLKDKDLLLQDILLFQVVNRLHGPLERFKEGLRTLGLLEEVLKHPEAFRPLFCSPPQLSADRLDQLFDICFSSAGSNRRVQENIAVAFWRDYLLDAEEGNSPCSLEKILMFATGCSALPAIGLKPQPSIEFLHTDSPLPGYTQQREKFPTANTCVNCLRLPLHKDYTAFKYNMDFAICNTQGFGQE
ncbi:hypothetical protein UPYG_G00287310 [Umbra pygmaea]|uniref:HECT-type E3 ubiquitin transferase n=1 Tax=Umbra pygmaea TaxID=75934 RepID=A0ABD0WNM9_UMBPY